MHSYKDILEIVENNLTKGGQVIENMTELDDAKKAEKLFTDGLSKLKALKLPRAERRDLQLLERAFEESIKMTQAIQKVQVKKAQQYANNTVKFANKYNSAVRRRVVYKYG